MVDKQHNVKVTITGEDRGAIAVTKRLGQNLKTVGDLATQFARRAAASMAVLNTALVGSAVLGARLGDSFAKTAFRLDTSVSSLRELSFAAEQSGADIGALKTSLRRLSAGAYDASNGLAESVRAFRDVGVNFRDAKGNLKAQDVLFKEVAVSLGKMENATKRQALAQRLLGRSGDLLAPLFVALAANSESFANILKLVNSELDDGTAKQSERVVDILNILKKSVEGVQFAMLRALAPAIERVALFFSAAIAVASRWIDRNREVVASIAKWAFAIGAAITGVLGLVTGVAALGSALSAWATFMSGPFAVATLEASLVLVGMGLVVVNLGRASDYARVRFTILIGTIAAGAAIVAGFTKQWKLMVKALVIGGGLTVAAIFSKDIAEKMDEMTGVAKEIADEMNKLADAAKKLKKEFSGLDAETDAVDKFLKQIRDSLLKTEFDAFTGIIGKLGEFGLNDEQFNFFRKQIQRLLKDLETDSLKDIDETRNKIKIALLRLLTLPIDPSGVGSFPGDFEALKTGIAELFGILDKKPSPKLSLELLALANALKDVAPEVARALQQLSGINNVLQLVATQALAEFGNVGVRIAQSMLDNFLKIGDAVGNLVEGIFFGTSELTKLQEQIRIQELSAQIATTVEEQERWTEAAEETRREVAKLELAAIQNQSAWGDFFKSMTKWFAKMISDIAAVIAKLAILKALSAFGPFGFLGSFLPFGGGGGGGGGAAAAAGGGGFLTPTAPPIPVPGFAPESFSFSPVTPTDEADDFAGSVRGPNPTVVNIQAGLLAGDEGTAREIVRMIQEKMRFNDSGKTI